MDRFYLPHKITGSSNRATNNTFLKRLNATSAKFLRLKKILDHIHDMVFFIDLASEKIVLANQRACDVLEYSPDEITQLRLKDIHPYEMPAVIEFAEKVRAQKGAISNELNCRTKSGRFLPAEVSGKTLIFNGNEYLIATVRRASERKADEKDLLSKHEKLEKLVQIRTRELEDNNCRLLSEIAEREKAEEQARNLAFFPEENPNPVFRVSEEGIILYGNLASKYILDKWETGAGKALPEMFYKNTPFVFELQKSVEVEYPVSDRFYSFAITHVQDKECVNIYAQNITEKKKAQDSLLHAKIEAEKANHAKSDFLSKMSHELRTPMNAVLGFSQLLKIDPENNLTPIQQEQLDHILTAGKHLLDLISEILDLAKVESGNISLNLESINVVTLIEGMKDTLQPVADEHGIRLSIVLDPSINLTAWADQLRLRQILFNLVSNAIKYNCTEGSVTVACKPLNRESIQVDIIDTGLGISAEDQNKLFEPFVRLGDEHSGIEGTGIGLTVTKELIELMGGTIGMTSKPGEGSHFYVKLPVAEKA